MAGQENNFEARFCAWDYFIPFYFTFGSFYLESMKYIDVNYPGLKEMLAHTGCQCKDKRSNP